MPPTFVDTFAWLAQVNRRDNYHKAVMTLFARLLQNQGTFVTTDFVLVEVADALSDHSKRHLAVDLQAQLHKQSFTEVVPVSPDLLAAGWTLYKMRKDKGWSLTDCISFAYMKQANLTTALTRDHHFRQAGYITLL